MPHTAHEWFSSFMRSAKAFANMSGFVKQRFVNILGLNSKTDTGVTAGIILLDYHCLTRRSFDYHCLSLCGSVDASPLLTHKISAGGGSKVLTRHRVDTRRNNLLESLS
jgi:hypothetical protein